MSTKLVFYFLNGQREEFFFERNSLYVGRGSDCDIVLPYEGISRKHLLIEFSEAEVFVTDLASTNGVLIDGKKIPPHVRTPYQTFLNLHFGPVQSVLIEMNHEKESSLSVGALGEALKSSPEDSTSKMDSLSLKKHRTPKGTTVRKYEKKPASLPLVFMAVLVLGGGFYYQFFMNVRTESLEIEEAIVENPGPPAPIVSTFTGKEELIDLMKSANCSETELCRTLRLNPALKEGVITQGESVLAFINLEEHRKRPSQKVFQELSSIEQSEVFLLEQLAESSIIPFIYRHKIYTNIQLIGFDAKGVPFMNLKLNRDINRTYMDRVIIGTMVDEARNLGIVENIQGLRSEYQTLLY